MTSPISAFSRQNQVDALARKTADETQDKVEQAAAQKSTGTPALIVANITIDFTISNTIKTMFIQFIKEYLIMSYCMIKIIPPV